MKKANLVELFNYMKQNLLQHKDAKEEIFFSLTIITYTKEINGVEKPCLLIFRGISCKAIKKFYYNNETNRLRSIDESKKIEQEKQDYKQKKLTERKKFRTTLKVGDILKTSWGYDQTNVNFYQITEIKNNFVTIQQIQQKEIEDGFMSGKTTPLKDKFCNEPIKKKILPGNFIKISNHYTNLWNGQPCYFSYYG